MSPANCSGVLGTGSAINCAKRVFVSGACKADTNAALSRDTTSRGVPAGAIRPHQVSISKPGSVSAMVGTSGSSGLRTDDVTASGSSLPARMLTAAVARLSRL